MSENKQEFFVETPLGKLHVYAKTEDKCSGATDFPGVWIDWINPDTGEANPLVCTEYDPIAKGVYSHLYDGCDEPAESLRHESIDEFFDGTTEAEASMRLHGYIHSIDMDTHGIKLYKHHGSWHVIDHVEIDGHAFWLMAPDTSGTTPDHTVVDDRGIPVLKGLLHECLELHDGFDGHVIELLEQEVMPVEKYPDPSISVTEMKEYGYFWGGILPMRKEAALAAFQKDDESVYLLYEDDTEGIALNVEEIQRHAANGGIFGIEKVAWLAAQENANE